MPKSLQLEVEAGWVAFVLLAYSGLLQVMGESRMCASCLVGHEKAAQQQPLWQLSFKTSTVCIKHVLHYPQANTKYVCSVESGLHPACPQPNLSKGDKR